MHVNANKKKQPKLLIFSSDYFFIGINVNTNGIFHTFNCLFTAVNVDWNPAYLPCTCIKFTSDTICGKEKRQPIGYSFDEIVLICASVSRGRGRGYLGK